MPTSSAPRIAVIDLNATSLSTRLPPDGEARLRAATPPGWELRFVRALTSSEGDGQDRPSDAALAAIGDAEVYFGYGMSPPLLDAGPAVRWVQSASAGVRRLLFPGMLARDVLLTNAAGIYGPTMAETVLAGVLYFLRGLDVALARQREARWDKDPWADPQRSDRPALARELPECRVLVIGAGGIGAEIGRRFSALGAHCVGVRRRPELGVPDGFASVIGPDAVDGELPRVDVVVLAAPSTEATHRLLDERRLGVLPPRAIVVNVGRGALVDEGALAAALAAGRLRGAVLDVFEREPLPPESPLWGLPNALVLPHVSGISPALFWHRMLDLFTANWERYRRGEPLVNLVDKAAGY